jgi:DNA-binding transcriptional regulator YiaG
MITRTFLWDGTMMSMLRSSADITQARMAENLDVSQHTIQSWESGRTQPKGAALLALAALLKVDPHEFYGHHG